MVFVETSVFTSSVKKHLSDDDYRALQWLLVRDPKRGSVIPSGGGLRKIRWSLPRRHKGKRSGVRVIYYVQSKDCLYMIFVYDKDTQKDLTRAQLRQLQGYIKLGVL